MCYIIDFPCHDDISFLFYPEFIIPFFILLREIDMDLFSFFPMKSFRLTGYTRFRAKEKISVFNFS